MNILKNTILNGDIIEMLATLPDNSVNCCVTSPPYYGLRDYGMQGQIGLEKTPQEYINKLVLTFREVRRVLATDGTLWLNIGDSYAGGGNNRGNSSPLSAKQASNRGAIGQCHEHVKNMNPKLFHCKPKDMIGIPWQLALALRQDGWYLRQDIIWHKPNPMPESVKDRCTSSHEYIFLLSKSRRYYYDYKSISEAAVGFGKDKRSTTGPTFGKKYLSTNYKITKSGVYNSDGLRNKRSVWSVSTKSYKGAHFATFPEALVVDCIKAGCPVDGVVLDPFFGSGTTGIVALKNNRNYIGIELNPDYVVLAKERINKELGLFA